MLRTEFPFGQDFGRLNRSIVQVANIGQQKKKFCCFQVLNVLFCGLEAPPRTLDVLHRGLGINILQFFLQTNCNFFLSTVKCYNFWASNPWIRISIALIYNTCLNSCTCLSLLCVCAGISPADGHLVRVPGQAEAPRLPQRFQGQVLQPLRYPKCSVSWKIFFSVSSQLPGTEFLFKTSLFELFFCFTVEQCAACCGFGS